MKENSTEDLKQRLQELYQTQQARLDVGADDLDIREEIAEVEDEIKESEDDINEENNNGNDTNVGSIENNIKESIERLKLCSTNQCHICGRYEKEECMLERNRCEQHILSDYKRVLKENEELKSDNLEYQRIQDIFDKRTYRKKYLEERRKEEPNLLYPDTDEIYRRYYELKKENQQLRMENDILKQAALILGQKSK